MSTDLLFATTLTVAIVLAATLRVCHTAVGSRRPVAAPTTEIATITTDEWRAAFRRHARVTPGTLAPKERRSLLRDVAAADAAAAAAVASYEAAELPYAEFLRILEQHGVP